MSTHSRTGLPVLRLVGLSDRIRFAAAGAALHRRPMVKPFKGERSATVAALIAIVALAVRCHATFAQPAPSLPFRFHNSMWMNLHHTLYLQARAGIGLDRETAERDRVVQDTSGFGQLTPEAQREWAQARTYYARRVARR